MKDKNGEIKEKRNRVSISLSDDELEKLQEMANNEGLEPTTFLKKVALKNIVSKLGNKENQGSWIKKEVGGNQVKVRFADNQVKVRFADNEIKMLEKLSQREGVRKATLSRNIILKTLNSKLFLTNDIEQELKQLRYLLSNMANNINQMAHHSNTIKRVVDDDQVLLAFLRIEKTVNGFIEYRLKEGG